MGKKEVNVSQIKIAFSQWDAFLQSNLLSNVSGAFFFERTDPDSTSVLFDYSIVSRFVFEMCRRQSVASIG